MTGAVPLSAEEPVGVVGAGTMGAGIAQVASVAGHPVLLYDARPHAAANAVEQIGHQLSRLVDKGRMSAQEAADAANRVRPVEALKDLAGCPLVVEAIVEDLDAKRALFAELEQLCPPESVLATNTSTISVSAIADGLQHPRRLCGLHFFNPAPVMRLVEVPVGSHTDQDVAERLAATARAWGKTAIPCASTPGFVVNRAARPFYVEAQRIVEEGTDDCLSVDAAMRAEGFRMGPFELADLIGNDVNLASTASIWEQTGRDPRYEPTDAQRRLVEEGNLGRKTGRGWYDYADPPTIAPQPDERIRRRILATLVNEAAALVDRGEAAAADVDLAMRLAMNYPKGPLEWGDELGAKLLLEVLTALDRDHPGGRYRISERLSVAATSGGRLND